MLADMPLTVEMHFMQIIIIIVIITIIIIIIIIITIITIINSPEVRPQHLDIPPVRMCKPSPPFLDHLSRVLTRNQVSLWGWCVKLELFGDGIVVLSNSTVTFNTISSYCVLSASLQTYCFAF